MNPLAAASPASLKALRSTLEQMPDSTIGRVLPMLDALSDRDQADQILGAIRPRLRRLRPARPLAPMRLLFLPLDGAIMAPAAWRRGLPAIPRSVLAPLAALVQQVAPAVWAEVAAHGAGRLTDDLGLVGRLGGMLWPAAAAAFQTSTPPPGWAASGLKPEDAVPILKLASAVLRQGPLLWRLLCTEMPDPAPLTADLRAALLPLLDQSPQAFIAGLALLVERSTSPGSLASVAARLDPRAQALTEQALDGFLERCDVHDFSAETPAGGAAAAMGFARLLADMEDAPAADRARRRANLHRLRQRAAADCLTRFEDVTRSQMLAPLQAGAEAAALEDVARGLRRMARAGGKIGDAAPYDRGLAEILAQVAQRPARLPLMTAARLTEILSGPEAGLALLEAR